MSFPEGEILDLHLSLECGDNVVKLQTPKTETPHIPPKDAEEKAPSEDVASQTLFLSKRKLKDVADIILTNGTLKVRFDLKSILSPHIYLLSSCIYCSL